MRFKERRRLHGTAVQVGQQVLIEKLQPVLQKVQLRSCSKGPLNTELSYVDETASVGRDAAGDFQSWRQVSAWHQSIKTG